MIKRIKGVVRTIRENKQHAVESEPFNGYGFMRRVYGTEEIKEIDDIEAIPVAPSAFDKGLPKPFRQVDFETDIEADID